MDRPHSYAVYIPPRAPWLRVWMRVSQWRTRLARWRERGDGRDYTGREVRVVNLPDPGAGVAVGALGRVVRCQEPGTRRCLHHVAFEDGPGWVLPLPSRHVELL